MSIELNAGRSLDGEPTEGLAVVERERTVVGEPTNERRSRSAQHVDDTASFFLDVERDRSLRNTIAAVFLLERSPDPDVVRDRFERASRLVPGWRHRLVKPPLRLANPRWVVDRDFDLNYHVRRIGAPKEKTLASVLRYASADVLSGFDRDRPLWTVTIVDGLEDDRAALVIKVHHALTDGVGAVATLPLVVDLSPVPADPGPLPPVPSDDAMAPWALAVDAIATNGERFFGLARDAGTAALRGVPGVVRRPREAADAATRNLQAIGHLLRAPGNPLSPIMTERRGWSHFAALDADLGALRRAAKPRGATVNDAFITAIGYGFARYHERLGTPVEELQVTMAVSVRKPGDPLQGNRAMGGHFVQPVGTTDPAGDMQAVHALTTKLRDDVGQPLTRAAAPLMNAIGPLVSGYVGPIMKNCDLALTNVAGVEEPIWLGGAEVLATYGFGPSMGTATNATLLSYRSTAHVGLHMDTAAVSDVDLLVGGVREGLDAVVALGNE